MSRNELNQVGKIIEDFVIGNLKIAKNRVYQKRCEGGLELFEISQYLGAQCCSWVKRSVKQDDLWKRELFHFSYGNLFNMRQHNFDSSMNPILHNIAGHLEKFVFNFTTINENFLSSVIFENPVLTFERNRNHYLKKTFFTAEEWLEYGILVKKLTIDKIVKRDFTLISKVNFEANTGIILSDIKYNKLRGIAATSS